MGKTIKFVCLGRIKSMFVFLLREVKTANIHIQLFRKGIKACLDLKEWNLESPCLWLSRKNPPWLCKGFVSGFQQSRTRKVEKEISCLYPGKKKVMHTAKVLFSTDICWGLCMMPLTCAVHQQWFGASTLWLSSALLLLGGRAGLEMGISSHFFCIGGLLRAYNRIFKQLIQKVSLRGQQHTTTYFSESTKFSLTVRIPHQKNVPYVYRALDILHFFHIFRQASI